MVHTGLFCLLIHDEVADTFRQRGLVDFVAHCYYASHYNIADRVSPCLLATCHGLEWSHMDPQVHRSK